MDQDLPPDGERPGGAGETGGTGGAGSGAIGSGPPCEPDRTAGARARLLLAGALTALFGALLAYRVLKAGNLEQTALFYVGIPAVIALTVVFTARPRSTAGIAIAVTTIGLLLAGPLLDEGFVCLLMAAPLFYLVAMLVGWMAGEARRGGRRSRWHAAALGPVLLLLCAEGVAGVAYLPPAGEGRAAVVVPAPPSAVTSALAAEPDYAPPRALLFRAVPFPRPTAAEGTGLDVGDRRHIAFTPRRSLGLNAEPTPRGMLLEITESRVDADGGRVVFTVVDDTTLARWLDLRAAEATWRASDDGTRMAWTLHYHRTFEPSWYWSPVQRHAMDRAAGYLADTFAAGAAAPGEVPAP
ncbi:hypothetical protein ACFO4E_16900 [Nocardiopsis mangrovi]|uniref:Polyketide cyclase n=1 Tax=Nocardiopsis mangrovi TaxID=1179818 RepID=A0ABV9DYL5_9ACTN